MSVLGLPCNPAPLRVLRDERPTRRPAREAALEAERSPVAEEDRYHGIRRATQLRAKPSLSIEPGINRRQVRQEFSTGCFFKQAFPLLRDCAEKYCELYQARMIYYHPHLTMTSPINLYQ